MKQIQNLLAVALAVAFNSTALVAPPAQYASVKIDCEKAVEKAAACEVKREPVKAKPDLFKNAKPTPKRVHL